VPTPKKVRHVINDVSLIDVFKEGDDPTETVLTEDVEQEKEKTDKAIKPDPPEMKMGTNILNRSRSQVVTDQQADITLEKVFKAACDSCPGEDFNGYFLKQGLLMHRKVYKEMHNGKFYTDRVVVPESYRKEILRVAHGIPLSGHMGMDKTQERIEAHFYWPYLSTDVKHYCETCPECQLVARKLKTKRAPLKPVPVVSEPFKKIAIDLVGELPRTKAGNKYILTLFDYATRYPEAIALKTTHS
jgi:hypothetical protein